MTIRRDEKQIVKDFRAVARSFAEAFKVTKDHVRSLLGSTQNYHSGLFREGLLRTFLIDLLPRAVSVDSGFIYGFGQVPTSAQLDIIVWDSSRHAAVYRTPDFVIVPPESVIAVISVKSNMTKGDIEGALDNLFSVVPLDLAYRGTWQDEAGKPTVPPILKCVVGYESPTNVESVLPTVSEFYATRTTDPETAKTIAAALRKFDPHNPQPEQRYPLERVYTKLIVPLDGNVSFLQGWGPPPDSTVLVPPPLKRLPFMYRQGAALTSPLEKLVHRVLSAVYECLGTPGIALRAAWSDINPLTGWRFGDADEIEEPSGVALIDARYIAAV
jgi:hypothetical protein